MIQYKHMGAICTLNESLLKIAKLLNKSEEEYKSYREITFQHLQEFISKKLIKEEVCSILRRSAGIPFILTSLIKSYISHDKLSNFSHNKVVEILKITIETLLVHYKTYQNTRSDVSVHCLHILRIISDDTHIKPYAKEFYDLIISNIVDGLGNENWSIKNACMLLFSKIIKHNFNAITKSTPTFIEYFLGKEELKKKIFKLLQTEVDNQNSECNDCLILLVTFFSKFKRSKYVEINEQDTIDIVDILYKLSYKNNKLFRKILCSAIIQFSGSGSVPDFKKLVDLIEKNSNCNNTIDFAFNMMSLYKEQFKSFPQYLLENLLITKFNEKNYFVCSKIVKFFKNVIKCESQNLIRFLLQNLISAEEKDGLMFILIENIFTNLKINTKKPFYYKFIRNSLDYLLKINIQFKVSYFNLGNIQCHYEELVNFLLKKHSPSLTIDKNELINLITQKDILSKLNVNISTKLIDYLIINTDINSILSSCPTTSESLLNKLIELLNNNKAITKLVKRLLTILPKFLLFLEDASRMEIYLPQLLQTFYEFSLSFYEEKLRYSALQALNILLINEKINSKMGELINSNINMIMKIFIYTLNDEHPELRNFSCSIFCNFNKITPVFNMKNNNSFIIYSNEFLVNKIIKELKSNENLKEFYEYLIKENLYFLEDKSKLNNENKVFYYEPENRYIDNIELKVKIMAELIKGEESLSEGDKEIKSLNILVMLETFVTHITDNFYYFLKRLKKETTTSNEVKDIKKFPFSYLRKFIYKY